MNDTPSTRHDVPRLDPAAQPAAREGSATRTAAALDNERERSLEREQSVAPVRFCKGHGTANDFVFLSDPDAQLDLTADRVAAWCDRHRGIGGDGLIRAVRTRAMPGMSDLHAQNPGAEWFMDYRNADGSIAEMCGNGVRAFVHFLRTEGLIALSEGEELLIGTRAGVKSVHRVSGADVDPSSGSEFTEGGGDGAPALGDVGYYAVDLGVWRLSDPALAASQGADALVSAEGLDVDRPAVSVDMGNPHTVVALAHEDELLGIDLGAAPRVSPLPVAGTNVEFVVPREHGVHDGIGELRMRVHERGAGETLSCGTGAAAAAAAVRYWAGEGAPSQWLVDVPGGRVRVGFQSDLSGSEHAVLSGPAVMVAAGAALI